MGRRAIFRWIYDSHLHRTDAYLPFGVWTRAVNDFTMLSHKNVLTFCLKMAFQFSNRISVSYTRQTHLQYVCAQQFTIIRFHNEIEYFSLIQDNSSTSALSLHYCNSYFVIYYLFAHKININYLEYWRISIQFTDERDEEEQNKPKHFFSQFKKKEKRIEEVTWHLISRAFKPRNHNSILGNCYWNA